MGKSAAWEQVADFLCKCLCGDWRLCKMFTCEGFSIFQAEILLNHVAGSLFILMKCFFLLSSISAGITPLLHTAGKGWVGLWLTFLFFILALFFSKPRSLKKNRENNGL